MLGLNKPVIYLREYLRRGLEQNDRLMSCYADIDTGTISDGEMSQLDSTIETANGSKISAPDLRNGRQLALFKSLLNPEKAPFGFRMGDLLNELSEYFENRAQIRYELNKLRARGLVKRVQEKHLYRVTETGWRIMWMKLSTNLYFCEPLITMTYKKNKHLSVSQPSKFEEGYALLDQGLILITQELYIKKAA